EVVLGDPTSYNFAGSIGNPILASPSQPDLRAVDLLLDQDLLPNVVYELSLQLQDCAGNAADTTIQIGVPVETMSGDVLLNEILFNPLTGGADFVELVNTSENILDLADLQIGEGFTDTDSVFNLDPVSAVSVPFLPGQIVCLTKDVAFQKMTYAPPANASFVAMGGFPTYDDREGVVVLQKQDGTLLDRFAYLDDYHYPSLVD
ncbi:MAG: hypothetical protein AAGM67_19015, partial [Bacteroidota bacterium]